MKTVKIICFKSKTIDIKTSKTKISIPLNNYGIKYLHIKLFYYGIKIESADANYIIIRKYLYHKDDWNQIENILYLKAKYAKKENDWVGFKYCFK